MRPADSPRGSLFRKYAAYLAGLVSVALLASAAFSLYFSYRDTRTLVEELQREKARGAALRIQQFVATIESQLRAALPAAAPAGEADLREQHLELLRLLRQAPAVVDVAWIDTSGRQQAKASRLEADHIGAGPDLARHPGIAAAAAGKPHFSRVHFRDESEPYMSVATRGDTAERGAILAEVNLKFVWDVVSAIPAGTGGRAYVVDAGGLLVSHPDLSLVLGATDLSALAPVREALAGAATAITLSSTAADGAARRTLTASAPIRGLGWHVLVEQPVAEAYAPLYAAAARAALLFLAGIALAIGMGVVLARRMAAPIRALQQAATRIGEGHLDERIDITTGDELETLGRQFNEMAAQLRDSHASLESRIEERTLQLAAANRAKSRFLAAASHDLRQPVHALGLYVAQLDDAGGAAEREHLHGRIAASTAAISDLLEALLDISKLDAEAVRPQVADFSVQPLLTRLEASFSLAARMKGLRLRIRPSQLRLASDPMLVERIVMNLTSNALRYTHDGGILVTCRLREARARIEVWDTGIGMTPAERERIFEEFYQARPPGPGAAAGLGLGLAIVDRLARLLGLEVQVRSVAGRGSRFAIEVPLAAPTQESTGAAADAGPMRFEGATALVVDDDADARDAAAGLLRQWGWRVICCADTVSALAAVRDLPRLDVIVSDHRLAPDETGSQLIARVREATGQLVPAVLVSGEMTTELREMAASGGVHVLYKPIQAARLRTLLHHLLARAPA